MTIEELPKTDIWDLYERCKNYCRMLNMFKETDDNYRMYNGNQWDGLVVKGVEPIQENFIKPIVKYKVGTITSNLWAVNYSSENYENKEFKETADETCDLLNLNARKIWEKDNMDYKIKKIAKDSAINSEGIIYVNYDAENQVPVNEILSKNNVFYGNENDSDIQSQPYILIKKRIPVINAREEAKRYEVAEEEIEKIIGDNDYFEEAGELAKYEKDSNVTVVTKMYKKDGKVHFEIATRYCKIKEDTDTGLTLYPIEHMLWEEKEGSARGEGEVKHLIPNQQETNKILMRSALVVKMTAYQTKVVNVDKVSNPGDINRVGATIRIKNGQTVDDVNKVVGYINPAQMSPDVEKLRTELISTTRELAGAGDIATGEVNPEDASGKAILAVQQASQQPLVEQTSSLKRFIEGLARIWFDNLVAYSPEGITLEKEVPIPESADKEIVLQKVPSSVLEQLKISVKVDVTPKGAYDKYAQELSLENMFKAGMFNIQKLPELKIYVNLLDDDAVAPKTKLLKAIEMMEQTQKNIAMINANAQLMQQQVNSFINSDVNAQAGMANQVQALQ